MLSASGDLYAVSNAIVSSTPPLLTDTNDQCLIGDDITRLPSLRKSKSTKARKADYYQESEHYYEEEGYSYSYLKKVRAVGSRRLVSYVLRHASLLLDFVRRLQQAT